MPRGPVTAAQALALMGAGLAVGLLAGFVSRSRWTMLTAPVAHVAAFETARPGAEGATVDGIDPGGIYGVLAFLVGRGFYGVAGLLPMLVGAAYGAALARRAGGAPAAGRRRGLYHAWIGSGRMVDPGETLDKLNVLRGLIDVFGVLYPQ